MRLLVVAGIAFLILALRQLSAFDDPSPTTPNPESVVVQLFGTAETFWLPFHCSRLAEIDERVCQKRTPPSQLRSQA
jgi:hypothetical protein